MARNTGDTATIEAPQGEAQTDAQGEPQAQPELTDGEATPAKPKAKRQNRNTYTVPVTVPTDLHKLLLAKAEEDKTNVTQIARQLLAGYVSYTLPLVPARVPKQKFANKEDAAKYRKDRNARAKALLAALDAGEVSEETLAKYLAAQTAAKPAEAAAPAEPEAVTA